MPKPLDPLELVELMAAAYPERIDTEADDVETKVEELIEEACLEDPLGFVAEMLGRVVYLAPAMASPLSGEAHHVLGRNWVKDQQLHMVAAVKREVKTDA